MPSKPSSNQRNVALITGAGRRVGLAVASSLASHGYRVALHANESLPQAQHCADDIISKGGEAIAVGANLRDEAELNSMIDRTVDHFGRIDGLVNNASVWSRKRLEDVTTEDLQHNLDVNLLGTFRCSQKVGLVMVQQDSGGSIVNIGDWAVARPYADYSAYFVSKGSIVTLTRTLAVELAQRNPEVRVNAILPGPVLLPSDLGEREREAVIGATLVRREGRPENVAHAVRFLLENDFVTGIFLPVDGGRSIFAPSS